MTSASAADLTQFSFVQVDEHQLPDLLEPIEAPPHVLNLLSGLLTPDLLQNGSAMYAFAMGQINGTAPDAASPGHNRKKPVPKGNSSPVPLDFKSLAAANPQLMAVGAAALVTLVAIQSALAAIQSQIAVLDNRLTAIQDFLDTQRRANLTGTLRYLREQVPALIAGETNPALRQKIDDLQHELFQIEDQLLHQMKQLEPRILRKDSGFSLGSEAEFNELSLELNEFIQLLDQLHLVMVARLAVIQVFLAAVPHPQELHLKRTRLNDFGATLAKTQGGRSPFPALGACSQAFKSRINSLDSTWNKAETLAERRNQLLVRLEEILYQYEDRHEALVKAYTGLEGRWARLEAGMPLLVRWVDGKPVFYA